ncbi:MAG: hypothetical protein DRQ49_05615 [Gammaproteobacteria bacterium]|nr:MAG: hypothetical protein DRQ41_09285 [Gammaproteobacteria bacterium]RKZ41301.1 MAG: hypothetical protein DRQ49_05615 [Gammaproteobacteria bacterium]RKZ74542.1 MAG: hypothetical protein DRQ57_10690 [Gammaproteobacteria bacterium]
MVDGAISVKPVKWQYRGNRGDGERANLYKNFAGNHSVNLIKLPGSVEAIRTMPEMAKRWSRPQTLIW